MTITTAPCAAPLPTVAVAAELGARADARWEELDAGCRIPTDLADAALAGRLLRTLVPAAMGGTGDPPLDWFRVGIELARHEPSYGWYVSQGAAELGWIAAAADPVWAAEVLADPLGSSASSVAGRGELVDHGATATLSGRWSFNTGAQAATWLGGLAQVKGATDDLGSPVVRFACVPAERAVIVEDWDPAGMRGTGSHSIVIPHQEIETAWTFSPFVPTPHERGPHRCLVGNGNWPIAGSVAATQLGTARRALDEATQIVLEKAPAPDFLPLAGSSAVQRTLLRAEGMWRACCASVERELEAMWDEAVRHGELSMERRVALLAANTTANEQSVAIVDAMCEVTGTAAVARRHPLSRCRRDVHALQGHLATNGATLERAAQVKLGLLAGDRRV